MSLRIKLILLAILTLAIIIVVFSLQPIPQDPVFHNFFDKRPFGGIPNFGNVVSNLPFFIIGIYGLSLLNKSTASGSIRWIYGCLFAGVLLISLGSGYYHGHPDNDRLVYDRIPMTLVFMSLLTATVAEFINLKQGARLLALLLTIGVFSVLWWHYTESQGKGDLRLYFLVQYYPMLFIPLILLLFRAPAHNQASRQLIWVVVWYVVAKLLEKFDQEVYSITGMVSGHSLKHLAAAMSTWYLVRMFQLNYIPRLSGRSL
ncbi:MAG: ceramidase domain-containing protein [Bacteroidota bacterium]